MVASPTELRIADADKVTKRLTPSTLEAADLSGPSTSTNNSVSVVHAVWFFPPKTQLRFHEALALMAVQR